MNHAKAAYLSSLTQCFSWITKIIPDTSAFNLHMDELISSLRLVSDRSFPSDLLFNLAKTQRLQIQSKINEALDKFTLESLTRSPTITLRDKALLMCSSTQYAGSWLSACPSRLKGNYLESRLFTLAFRYWFGVPIFPDVVSNVRAMSSWTNLVITHYIVNMVADPHAVTMTSETNFMIG